MPVLTEPSQHNKPATDDLIIDGRVENMRYAKLNQTELTFIMKTSCSHSVLRGPMRQRHMPGSHQHISNHSTKYQSF